MDVTQVSAKVSYWLSVLGVKNWETQLPTYADGVWKVVVGIDGTNRIVTVDDAQEKIVSELSYPLDRGDILW